MKKGEAQLKRIKYFSAFVLLVFVEAYIAVFVRDNFIRPYVGDVLAVMVVYYFVRTVRPEGCKRLPLFVFLFAVCVEITQYFNLVGLIGMKGNRVVSIILGGTFDWVDVLCYGIGCSIIWVFSFFKLKRKKEVRPSRPSQII